MKQKFLSMCLALVMILTAVLGIAPQSVVQAADLPETIVVKGGDVKPTSDGSYAINVATEQAQNGEEVNYCQITGTQYSNGLWDVTFDEAGRYQMSFLAAVTTAPTTFRVYTTSDGKDTTIFSGAAFAATDTENTYTEFPGPTVDIAAAGTYTFKIGSWAAGADFKIGEIRLACLQVADPEAYHEVKTGEELVLSEMFAAKKQGSLNPATAVGDYVDYRLDVKEAGDYTLTYTIGSNNLASGTGVAGYQAIVNPDSENPVEATAMQVTKFWGTLPQKQTIHLEAGQQVLRIKALVDDLAVNQIAINAKTVHAIKADAENIIGGGQFVNASDRCVVEAAGNVGYAPEGLEVTYEVNVEKSGVYTLSYNYVSKTGTTLTTKIDGTEAGISTVDAFTGSGNYYESTYLDSDEISFHLDKGVHTLTTVWGATDLNVKSLALKLKTADPESYTFSVEAELGAEGSGQWDTQVGEEKDSEGNDVTYAYFPAQWNNGRYIVNFPYAGTYKMQLRIAVPTKASNVHLEVAPEGGSFQTLTEKSYPVTETANTYVIVDGWDLEIEEAGNYDLKFGCWTAGTDFKVDKFIFTCDNPVAPPSADEPLVVEKGKSLVLKEALAANKSGSLRTNPSVGSYVDYVIEVKESGDYTLTYNVAANSAEVADAFQVQVAPFKEEVTNDDFTTKLDPLQMTHYYAAVQEKQSIHLDAGKYILRTKALNEGFGLTQFTITEQFVTEVSEDGTPAFINAVDFNNGTNYHAIQNATSTDAGNIGYASLGLGLDYAVKTTKGGIYTIVYSYTSSAASSLTAQRVMDDGSVIDLASSALAAATAGGNWYDAPYIESEEVSIMLPAGMNTLRVHWDAADINLKSFTLSYKGSAVEYVTDLLSSLPAKDVLTLADESAVNKAKASYDALTDEEKPQISADLVEKLNDDIAQIPVLKLEKAISDNKEDLEKTFAKYKEEEYKADKWEKVIAEKDAGIAAISKATTIAEADKALRDAKAAMEAVEKKLKSILLTPNNTAILAQSKAYRKNGSLNSNVKAGNWADYYVNVQEAGEYTFTYALYSDEAVADAFAIKYDASENSEYPETITNEYAKVSVPKVTVEGNLVKEIRGTVSLSAGEQTIRFEALSDKVRLNRITITKKQAESITEMKAGEVKVIAAADFAEAANQYVLASNVVTGTADGTALDYPISLESGASCFISFNYAYAGSKAPVLAVSTVDAAGKETALTSVKAGATDGQYVDSEQAAVALPAGTYTLRVTMKNDGVDLKSFTISGSQKNIPAEGIALNAYKVTMDPTATFKLTAALVPENTTSGITWTSSDNAVATVSEDGLITAVKEGSAVITAEADGKKAVCQVTVGESTSMPGRTPTFIERVSVSTTLTTLYAGGNADNNAAIRIVVPTGAALAKAEYAVSDAKVATVSAAGMITAKKAGKAVVTVKITLTNGETATLQKQITVKKAYIKLKKASYSVKKGKSVTLKATAYGSSKKITYKIATGAGKKIAKVSSSGKLTGKKKGTVKVTATSGKVKKTFKVKVK